MTYRKGNVMYSRNKREGYYEGKKKLFYGIRPRHTRCIKPHSLSQWHKYDSISDYMEDLEQCRGCERYGEVNTDRGYYCGSSERCCP